MSEETPFLHESPSAQLAARVERRWATVCALIIALFTAVAAFAGIHQATMPQARVETIQSDPAFISGGEFVETILGTAFDRDGSVTVRARSARNIPSRRTAS